ncbi:two-component regulator propeller domain-containing protein [Sphingomonas sp. LB2R24]|uniref:sensor histidine kinase n=1 Tax=Sphingomonas sorbitolis TaxID=3096165 RepID=UPI002FCC9FD0
MVAFCWMALLVIFQPVGARAAPTAIRDLKHTRWTIDDGTPPGIKALAQTADGYLWVGGDTGLYRFDGVRFEKILTLPRARSRDGAVTALLSARDGDLWIGFGSGAIGVLHDGNVIDRSAPGDARRINAFAEDGRGTIWVMTGKNGNPLLRWTSSGWLIIDRNWGFTGYGQQGSHVTDGDGALWAIARSTVYRLAPKATRFVVVGDVGYNSALAVDPAGKVWLSTPSRTAPIDRAILRAPTGSRRFTPGHRAFMFDGRGAIWGHTEGAGIFRIAAPGKGRSASAEEHFAARDGLSSDSVAAMMEDREGTVWVGTAIGLDRFRAAAVVLERGIPPRSRFGYVLLATRDGFVHAVDSDSAFRIAPGAEPAVVLRGLNNPEALCEDTAGVVWLATSDAMYRNHGKSFGKVKQPEGRGSFLDCARSSDGRVWFSRYGGGMAVYDHGDWSRILLPTSEQGGVVPILTSVQGGILDYRRNIGLYRFHRPNAERLWRYADMPHGQVSVLYQHGSDVLIGSNSGLARLREGKLTVLQRDYPWLQGISGIVASASGEIWILARAGIVQLQAIDLEQALEDQRRILHPRIYDVRDGLPGPPTEGYAKNSAVAGGDGRLWFITTEGVVRIDPARLVRNAVVPPVRITGLHAGDIHTRDPQSIRLSKGTSQVEIDYTALSLAIPERVRFRYKLDGIDKDWIEAGNRRQAFYTNLQPGSYSFTVIAANNDGVWNTKGASSVFRIPPTFLQSGWFVMLCTAAVAVLLWLTYRARVRFLTAQLRARHAARLGERERIARDLHDTLLQTFQGLIYRFQAAANRLPKTMPARVLLEDALDRADAALIEGRDRVTGLRAVQAPGSLSQALLEVADEMSTRFPAGFRIVEEGQPKTLSNYVADEIQQIAVEAVRNAFQHGKATSIEVTICYDIAAFRFGLRDNGIGIDTEQHARGSKPGHFGLVGMRERAARVGGLLRVSSNAGNGVEVLLTVPADRAYSSLPSARS